MSLTFGLKTPRDMLGKLNREHERLEAQITSDDFFNFVVTAYHLIDWIDKNPSVPEPVRTEVKMLYRNPYIAICRDLANASKHFVLKDDYRGQVTEKVSAITGYGVGGYGKGDYGTGEPTVIVILTDGQRFDALTLAHQLLELWTGFFKKHGL